MAAPARVIAVEVGKSGQTLVMVGRHQHLAVRAGGEGKEKVRGCLQQFGPCSSGRMGLPFTEMWKTGRGREAALRGRRELCFALRNRSCLLDSQVDRWTRMWAPEATGGVWAEKHPLGAFIWY